MDIKNIHRVYFLGIGGIGMSAIARYFLAQKMTVAGYDKTPSVLTRKLEVEGMSIHYEDDIDQILSSPDLVIYTPAIPQQLNEFRHLQKAGIPLIKRAEVLGWISTGKPCIAIAGTHGKTTITAMIAHLLYQSSPGCTALVGGILKNHKSNFIQSGNPAFTVVEADEYDRSFLHLHPELAVISAMDADHMDIYADKTHLTDSFIDFAGNINSGGKLLVKKGLSVSLKNPQIKLFTYSIAEDADYFATNISNEGSRSFFDLNFSNQKIEHIELMMPGRVNVENAVAASAIALMAGISEQELRDGLKSFAGIHRRFDVQFNSHEKVYIDDYAHHPAEIEAVVKSVRLLYPGKKICGIFQPHLFSRTRDFALEFAEALSRLDEVILLPIYPAREKPMKGVDSSLIFNQIKKTSKSMIGTEHLLSVLDEKDFDVLLTLGAGDIDRFRDAITNLLSKKLKTTFS